MLAKASRVFEPLYKGVLLSRLAMYRFRSMELWPYGVVSAVSLFFYVIGTFFGTYPEKKILSPFKNMCLGYLDTS
jgi:lipopolysaccharide export LptBFGC system permease protein LptF